jgi:hypothetical protein
MAKQITLADLNNTVKSLLEAVHELKNEQMLSTAQVSELYTLTTNLNLKFDTMDNNVMPATAVKKPVPKKTAAKEVKRVPIKKGAKHVAEPDDAEEKPDDEETAAEQLEEKPESDTESEDVKVVKSAVKARPINKMEFFKIKFTENPAFFDNMLTAAQKKETTVHKSKSTAEKLKIWYEFVKDNPELQTLKADYIKEQATHKLEIASKEDNSD